MSENPEILPEANPEAKKTKKPRKTAARAAKTRQAASVSDDTSPARTLADEPIPAAREYGDLDAEDAQEELPAEQLPAQVSALRDTPLEDEAKGEVEASGQPDTDGDEDPAHRAEDEPDAPTEEYPADPSRLQRLQKILAQAGIASRRKAEDLIQEGRVQINGKLVTELGTKADPDRDHIRVDGKLLRGAERLRYFMLNKPKGYVTTVSDPEGRPTVMQFFDRENERLYPVGRLDYLSEGLLLVTNDGPLANKLTRAASAVEKVYLVKVSGNPTEEMLDQLRAGVMIERGRKIGEGRVRTAPAKIRQVRQGDNPWFEVILIEGRNRELRKMFEEVGHHVEKIRRVGYGPLVLDIEPGKVRELDSGELELLRKAADGKLKGKRRSEPLPAKLPRAAGKAARYRDEKTGKPIPRAASLPSAGSPDKPRSVSRPARPVDPARPADRAARPASRFGQGMTSPGTTSRGTASPDRPRRGQPFADGGQDRPRRSESGRFVGGRANFGADWNVMDRANPTPAGPAARTGSRTGYAADRDAARNSRPFRPTSGAPASGPGRGAGSIRPAGPAGKFAPGRPGFGKPAAGKPFRTGKPFAERLPEPRQDFADELPRGSARPAATRTPFAGRPGGTGRTNADRSNVVGPNVDGPKGGRAIREGFGPGGPNSARPKFDRKKPFGRDNSGEKPFKARFEPTIYSPEDDAPIPRLGLDIQPMQDVAPSRSGRSGGSSRTSAGGRPTSAARPSGQRFSGPRASGPRASGPRASGPGAVRAGDDSRPRPAKKFAGAKPFAPEFGAGAGDRSPGTKDKSASSDRPRARNTFTGKFKGKPKPKEMKAARAGAKKPAEGKRQNGKQSGAKRSKADEV